MGIKIRLFAAFCLTIILIGGGVALLSNMWHTPIRAASNLPADDLSVVGKPSLPASTVDSIFARLGSPMVGTGALVEQTSRATNIDDAFALAVWWTETNDGAAGVGLVDRNPGSVRGSVGYPSAYDGYTIYPSYGDAVVYWFHMLKNMYVIGRGLDTVYAISHPYVGTSTSYLWAGKVVALMQRYRGEAPPPPPPSPTVAPVVLAHNRHILRPVNTGITSKITPLSPMSVQKAAQRISLNVQQPQRQNAVLSETATWLIAIFALLLALAIAMGVQLFPRGLPVETRPMAVPSATLHMRASRTTFASYGMQQAPVFQAPVFHLPSRSLNEPQTDALVVNSPVSMSGQAGRPQGASLHIKMAPSHQMKTDESIGKHLIAPTLSSETASSLPTTGKLRPTRLMPSQPESSQSKKVAVPVGGRPNGLLARYGNSTTFRQDEDAPFRRGERIW